MATNNSPNKQTQQDAGKPAPAADPPAASDPASLAQARKPGPQPAVVVPRYDVLVDAGKRPSEALAIVEAAVAKAVSYGKVMRATHGHEPDVQPSREQVGPYRVTETKERVNYGGGLTTIPVGTIVDLRSYGLQGIARLREQGVKMELLEQD